MEWTDRKDIKIEANKVVNYTLDWIYQFVDLHNDNLKNDLDFKRHLIIRGLYNKNRDLESQIKQLEKEKEALKCCGNCFYTCELGRTYFPDIDCRNLDQWQPKEPV